MLLLASTSDVLSLLTSTTDAIDVQVSGMDMTPASTDRPVGYRKNTAIASIATTTVAAAPGSGVLRTVKTLCARNKGGAANTVTVRHTDGTTAVDFLSISLPAGYALNYHEGAGWWVTDNFGRNVILQASPDVDTIVRLASDVTNNNGSANTIADVTGLSFPVVSGNLYWFDFNIIFTAAATTTGSRWSINGPATTYLDYKSEYSLTTTSTTLNALLQAYDAPSGASATSAATGNNWARVYGVVQPSADGTVIARFASEVSSSAIVAKANSFVRYRRITT
jgi:hypothetical protein